MEDLLPTEFYLSQNHPNPFNERTTIKYCLAEEVKVKLEIFDSKEEKIGTLADEVKEPGTYQVEFRSNGFGEGVYLYQLTADGVILKKKMVLIK
jgi:hypothetical protein